MFVAVTSCHPVPEPEWPKSQFKFNPLLWGKMFMKSSDKNTESLVSPGSKPVPTQLAAKMKVCASEVKTKKVCSSPKCQCLNWAATKIKCENQSLNPTIWI